MHGGVCDIRRDRAQVRLFLKELRIHIKSKQNGEIPSIRKMTHVETPPDITHEDWCDKRDQFFQKSSLIEPNRGNALSKLYHRLACHMNLTQDNFRRRMGIVLKEGGM